MHARSGSLQLSPERLDAALDALKGQMRHYRDAKGFVRFIAMADRQSGKVLGISFWQTEADREASENLGAQARSSIQESGSGQSEPVREVWEVVLDEKA
jgi:hypothetical protein